MRRGSTDCYFGFSSDGICEWGCRDEEDNTHGQECKGPNCLCLYNAQVYCSCQSADSCGTSCCPAPWVTPDSAPPPDGCGGSGGGGNGGAGTGGSGTGGEGTSVAVSAVSSGSGP
ncbi:MAG: hypothetical protein WKG00_31315 [Polyangiaceae bacterium]